MPATKAVSTVAAGSEAAYQRHLPFAQKLSDAEVVPFRLDPHLAQHNVQVGLAALEPLADELKLALPRLDWKSVLGLDDLADAVIFAALQVAGPARSTGELAALLSEAAELRRRLLTTAEVLVLSGAFPAAAVDKIRRGTGVVDRVKDCIELAALYRKYPVALKQQAAVTAQHVKRASELGTDLLGRLKPAGARVKKAGNKDKADPAAAAVAIRDRLATLLVKRHAELRKAAYYQWGDAFDSHVPTLQAGRSRPKKPKTKPTPAPSPAPPG